MIERVQFQNYRTLVNLSFDLDELTVLVGPNGAGKTTILRALSFLLGSTWGPSLNQLSIPEDFTNLDVTRSMLIRADFNPPLTHTDDLIGKDVEVYSLSFSCQPYKVRKGDKVPGDLRYLFEPLGKDDKPVYVCKERPTKGEQAKFEPLIRVTGDLREQARVLSITEERSMSSQGAGRRGSVLALLLDEARRSFLRDDDGVKSNFGSKYQEAVEVLRTDELKAVEGTVQETARRMLGFVGGREPIELEFGFADPARPHTGLELLCRRGDLLLPAGSLGQGEQSAIVVGLFEALRQRGSSLNTVLIEEPEMYLHPQAQRYFRNLLLDIVDSKQAQVVISTHSPVFADMTRFRSIRIVRRSDEGTSVQRVAEIGDVAFLDAQLETAKLTQYFDAQTAELLFAEKVLLVEGHGDRLASLQTANKLGVALDSKGLSIIDCGGKNAIPFYARVCKALRIPCVILHDEDIYEGDDLPTWKQDANAAAPEQNSKIEEAAGNATEIYVVKPTLEEVLGISRSAVNKPMRVLESCRDKELSELPLPLVEAVRALAGLESET